MRVVVNPPHIDGETVVFSWTQSEPNPYQHEDSFSFRYEGIDLTRFTNALFYEVFLGLQLKVFANYDESVEVVFPEPVSPFTVAFWQTYHEATRVTISPLATAGSYSPWRTDLPPTSSIGRRPIGALFGGGKDSTLATCLLSELYGADQVVVFQMAIPLHRGRDEMRRIERRQETLMLQPAREHLRVATQHVRTNYLSGQSKSQLTLRPHLELYSVGFLPAFLHWGVSLVTGSFNWSSYPFQRLANGEIWFRYPRSRPEMLATQSQHYHRTFDAEITLTNLNLLFSTFSAYRLLLERYPNPFTRIVMCVAAQPDERWCYHCNKCAEYALYGLANGIVDPRYDYNHLLSSSRYIRRVVDYIESGVERSVHGNVPWSPVFGSAVHYPMDCHAISHVAPEIIASRLGGEALGNLLTIKAAFGNTSFPYAEQIPGSAIELLGSDTARRAAAIAAEHFDIVHPLRGPFLTGNTPVEVDFSVRMKPATSLLEHLQP